MGEFDDGFEDGNESDEEENKDTAELEKEFETLAAKALPKIQEQLEIARKAIEKAEKISEKYGIPFEASVSPLSQSYFPGTFAEKFSELDSDFVQGITDAWSEYGSEGAGWEHSAVC